MRNTDIQADFRVFGEEFKHIGDSFNGINRKFDKVNTELSTVDTLNADQFLDRAASEALDRMNRAKNIFIRGVVELPGDSNTKKENDK
ncbi:hypothetical protein HHI36_002177, partial [Cryptolaemus montrouzieri]